LLAEFIKDIQGIEHACDVSLKKFTTFSIGGPADVLVSVSHPQDLHRVLVAAQKSNLPVMVLGGGSNVLISDTGVRGVVVHLVGELAEIKEQQDGHEILVGAGASFPMLTKKALELGFESALGWFGTPGQVGGALKMNAGTRLGEIGDVVHTVFGVSASGFHEFTKENITFAYRTTNFPSDVILTKALLHCDNPVDPEKENLRAKAKELYQKRLSTQPKMKSAGSMFKNPPGDFAGRLIESCGLKEMSIGGAQISAVHANFIVNTGDATAQDVYQLAMHVQKSVFEKFRILLEFEVKLIGNF